MNHRPTFVDHRGDMVSPVMLPGISIVDIYHRGGSAEEHTHAYPNLWLMLRGDYMVRCSCASKLVGPATLVYTPAGETHGDHIKSIGGHGMAISLGESFIASQFGGFPLPRRPAIATDPQLLWTAHQIRTEFQRIDAASSLIISGLVLEIMGKLQRSERDPTPEHALATRARGLVDQLYDDPGLSVGQLARELRTHPVYLARAFRRAIGQSPSEYIRNYRCDRAAKLLRSSGTSLAEIGYSCGFGDQSGFIRAFRRTYGTTPGAFRRATRPGWNDAIQSEPTIQPEDRRLFG